MAAIVQAVSMGVARRAALMTVRDNVIGDPLAHPFIKDKVFANETHRQPLLTGATGVLDDATLDVPDLIEAVMLHPGAGFFTANAAGAIHDNFLVFMVLHHFHGFRQLVAEGIRRDLQRVFEMAHLIFIVVAHIDKHGIRIVKHRVDFRRLEILPHIGGVKRGIVDAVGDDTIANFQAQHPERLTIVLHGDIETQPRQRRIEAIEKLTQSLNVALRHADLRVDPFPGQIDAAKDLQLG